jgi:carboxyl-terminal processing protease
MEYKLKKNIKIFTVFLIFLVFPAFSAKKLQVKDINGIMSRFFEYHVENKELTPKIVQRSIKLYIKQFDPERLYLTYNEVNPYFNISDRKAKKLAVEFKKGNFSIFYKIDDLFANSIIRARKMRISINEELLSKNQLKKIKKQTFSSYADSETDIFKRQRYKLYKFYRFHKNNFNINTKDRSKKVLILLEKRLQRFENKYIYMNSHNNKYPSMKKEHLFSLHILKAFAKSLDAHSSFFSEDEANEMRMSLEKQFEGIGVVLTDGIDGVIISDIIKGAPAEKSGKVFPNDIIFEIDGKNVVGVDFDTVMASMKKENDPKITLGIKRYQEDGREEIVYVQLKRESISMDDEKVTYQSEPFADGIIGKITLPSFYENGEGVSCSNDLKNAIEELKKQGDLKGIVLDLRENSGGFLTQAVKVAGCFLNNGVVVMSKYSNNQRRFLRNFNTKKSFGGPLIVLTSRLSASASEIVAQALQDYGVALIVGDEKTFGKGSIQYQTVTDEKAEVYFKVTVGKYYTVSGKTTQISGVRADVVVPTHYYYTEFGERYLDFPLQSDTIDSAYSDDLSDLDVGTRWWFKRNYLPNLQKKVENWQGMVPILKRNSQFRLDNSKNFSLFLKEQQKSKPETRDCNCYGVEDLQLEESINILKDMIILDVKSEKSK